MPGDKRLAVHVEDHPLDYADFEGEIPKGQYGGGEVIVWDRGRWEPEGDPVRGLKKGRLDFTLEGAKLKGRWHLVRMGAKRGEKHENWLLIKGSDEAARSEADAIRSHSLAVPRPRLAPEQRSHPIEASGVVEGDDISRSMRISIVGTVGGSNTSPEPRNPAVPLRATRRRPTCHRYRSAHPRRQAAANGNSPRMSAMA